MKVKDVIATLSEWPDEAEVELAVPVDLDSEDHTKEDKVMVETRYGRTLRR